MDWLFSLVPSMLEQWSRFPSRKPSIQPPARRPPCTPATATSQTNLPPSKPPELARLTPLQDNLPPELPSYPFLFSPWARVCPRVHTLFSALLQLTAESGMSKSENLMCLASVQPRDPTTGSPVVLSKVCGA